MLQKRTSWISVSNNVRKLIDEWEHEGRMGGRRPAPPKGAIRQAIALSLKKAGRNAQARPQRLRP
jgi:hypothetical protein